MKYRVHHEDMTVLRILIFNVTLLYFCETPYININEHTIHSTPTLTKIFGVINNRYSHKSKIIFVIV